MTDAASLVSAIESEPERLDDYADDLHAILDSGETEERQAVAQALKEVTDQTPAVVARHTDLLETALRDEDETVCGAALHTVVILTENHQYRTTSLGGALLAALTTMYDADTTNRISGIDVLTVISNSTVASVSEGDEVFAALFHNGDDYVRQMVAANISSIVSENPSNFPHMRRAYVDGLTDIHPDVRLAAAQTLAAVARDDISAVPDIETVQERMKNLRNHHDLDRNDVEPLIRMVRQAANDTAR